MDDILIQIVVFILIDVPIVIYVVKRIMDSRNISPERKKIYLVLACIVPLFALLFYHMESNRRIREKYSSKSGNNSRITAEG
jgi:hypothetical protein